MRRSTYTDALLSLLAATLAFVLSACANVPVEGSPVAIVGGTPGGDRAVVWVYRSDGALCSGTLIAPRVVLTAKHCVQPSGAAGPAPASWFTVGIGDQEGTGTVLRVQSVHTTPGTWTSGTSGGFTGALQGVDVAVLVLVSGVADVTPIPILRTSPSSLAGQSFTACGFGQIPSGGAGHKYNVHARVSGVSVGQHLIYVGAVFCSGDSGGPLITADNHVGGIVSYGSGTCGSGFGAYQAIDAFLPLIDAALTEAGMCLNDGPEVCDGHDNNCDGRIDEGCQMLGGGCSSSLECVGGMCETTAAGHLCTAPCDARRPTFGCEAGFFCAAATASACNGWCIPITGDHTLPNEAHCASSSECASFLCEDPGDGVRRCLSPCRGGAGECLAGEACVANPGQCGGCVPAAILAATRRLGEPCTADAECASMRCLTDGNRRYCSDSCTSDTTCGRGYHCRVDHCVTGDRGQAGEPCTFDPMQHYDDCNTSAGLFCVRLGTEDWCSEVCGASSPDNHMCADGFQCADTGSTHVCAPMHSLLGQRCTANTDCISQLCAASPRGGAMVCTRNCGVDAACSTGFECVRTSDGANAYCVSEPPPAHAGGCTVAHVDGGGRSGSCLLALCFFTLAGSSLARRRVARR